MINCGTCGNTRKVTYQEEEITCPICEEYIVWRDEDVSTI